MRLLSNEASTALDDDTNSDFTTPRALAHKTFLRAKRILGLSMDTEVGGWAMGDLELSV